MKYATEGAFAKVLAGSSTTPQAGTAADVDDGFNAKWHEDQRLPPAEEQLDDNSEHPMAWQYDIVVVNPQIEFPIGCTSPMPPHGSAEQQLLVADLGRIRVRNSFFFVELDGHGTSSGVDRHKDIFESTPLPVAPVLLTERLDLEITAMHLMSWPLLHKIISDTHVKLGVTFVLGDGATPNAQPPGSIGEAVLGAQCVPLSRIPRPLRHVDLRVDDTEFQWSHVRRRAGLVNIANERGSNDGRKHSNSTRTQTPTTAHTKHVVGGTNDSPASLPCGSEFVWVACHVSTVDVAIGKMDCALILDTLLRNVLPITESFELGEVELRRVAESTDSGVAEGNMGAHTSPMIVDPDLDPLQLPSQATPARGETKSWATSRSSAAVGPSQLQPGTGPGGEDGHGALQHDRVLLKTPFDSPSRILFAKTHPGPTGTVPGDMDMSTERSSSSNNKNSFSFESFEETATPVPLSTPPSSARRRRGAANLSKVAPLVAKMRVWLLLDQFSVRLLLDEDRDASDDGGGGSPQQAPPVNASAICMNICGLQLDVEQASCAHPGVGHACTHDTLFVGSPLANDSRADLGFEGKTMGTIQGSYDTDRASAPNPRAVLLRVGDCVVEHNTASSRSHATSDFAVILKRQLKRGEERRRAVAQTARKQRKPRRVSSPGKTAGDAPHLRDALVRVALSKDAHGEENWAIASSAVRIIVLPSAVGAVVSFVEDVISTSGIGLLLAEPGGAISSHGDAHADGEAKDVQPAHTIFGRGDRAGSDSSGVGNPAVEEGETHGMLPMLRRVQVDIDQIELWFLQDETDDNTLALALSCGGSGGLCEQLPGPIVRPRAAMHPPNEARERWQTPNNLRHSPPHISPDCDELNVGVTGGSCRRHVWVDVHGCRAVTGKPAEWRYGHAFHVGKRKPVAPLVSPFSLRLRIRAQDSDRAATGTPNAAYCDDRSDELWDTPRKALSQTQAVIALDPMTVRVCYHDVALLSIIADSLSRSVSSLGAVSADQGSDESSDTFDYTRSPVGIAPDDISSGASSSAPADGMAVGGPASAAAVPPVLDTACSAWIVDAEMHSARLEVIFIDDTFGVRQDARMTAKSMLHNIHKSRASAATPEVMLGRIACHAFRASVCLGGFHGMATPKPDPTHTAPLLPQMANEAWCDAVISATVDAYYQNHHIMALEPCLEPWPCSLTLEFGQAVAGVEDRLHGADLGLQPHRRGGSAGIAGSGGSSVDKALHMRYPDAPFDDDEASLEIWLQQTNVVVGAAGTRTPLHNSSPEPLLVRKKMAESEHGAVKEEKRTQLQESPAGKSGAVNGERDSRDGRDGGVGGESAVSVLTRYLTRAVMREPPVKTKDVPRPTASADLVRHRMPKSIGPGSGRLHAGLRSSRTLDINVTEGLLENIGSITRTVDNISRTLSVATIDVKPRLPRSSSAETAQDEAATSESKYQQDGSQLSPLSALSASSPLSPSTPTAPLHMQSPLALDASMDPDASLDASMNRDDRDDWDDGLTGSLVSEMRALLWVHNDTGTMLRYRAADGAMRSLRHGQTGPLSMGDDIGPGAVSTENDLGHERDCNARGTPRCVPRGVDDTPWAWADVRNRCREGTAAAAKRSGWTPFADKKRPHRGRNKQGSLDTTPVRCTVESDAPVGGDVQGHHSKTGRSVATEPRRRRPTEPWVVDRTGGERKDAVGCGARPGTGDGAFEQARRHLTFARSGGDGVYKEDHAGGEGEAPIGRPPGRVVSFELVTPTGTLQPYPLDSVRADSIATRVVTVRPGQEKFAQVHHLDTNNSVDGVGAEYQEGGPLYGGSVVCEVGARGGRRVMHLRSSMVLLNDTDISLNVALVAPVPGEGRARSCSEITASRLWHPDLEATLMMELLAPQSHRPVPVHLTRLCSLVMAGPSRDHSTTAWKAVPFPFNHPISASTEGMDGVPRVSVLLRFHADGPDIKDHTAGVDAAFTASAAPTASTAAPAASTASAACPDNDLFMRVCLSQDEVAHTILSKTSFSTIKHPATTSRRGGAPPPRGNMRLLSFHAPLVIENRLPRDIHFRLELRQNPQWTSAASNIDDHVIRRKGGRIYSGQEKACYAFSNQDPDMELLLRVGLGSEFSQLGSAVVLPDLDGYGVGGACKDVNTVRVAVQDSEQRTLHISLEMTRKVCGTLRIAAFVPYWLQNNSGLPLLFRYDPVAKPSIGRTLWRMVVPSGMSSFGSRGALVAGQETRRNAQPRLERSTSPAAVAAPDPLAPFYRRRLGEAAMVSSESGHDSPSQDLRARRIRLFGQPTPAPAGILELVPDAAWALPHSWALREAAEARMVLARIGSPVILSKTQQSAIPLTALSADGVAAGEHGPSSASQAGSMEESIEGSSGPLLLSHVDPERLMGRASMTVDADRLRILRQPCPDEGTAEVVDWSRPFGLDTAGMHGCVSMRARRGGGGGAGSYIFGVSTEAAPGIFHRTKVCLPPPFLDCYQLLCSCSQRVACVPFRNIN